MPDKHCRLCGRVGSRDFVVTGGENWMYECSNDRACKRRRREGGSE